MVPFDPNVDAILPTHRVVAFYAVPGASATGPAYKLSRAMLARLRAQGAAYQKLDPAHPVALGIDLVVDVPDRFKGRGGTYSHYVDAATIEQYVAFCQKNDLLLFLDLNIGWAKPLTVLHHFDNYLKLPFVDVAIDPEWMFPRHNGIPGVNLSNVRASDLNPLIEAVAAMPMEYHVPRKIMIIHQYRGDGDGKANPYDAGLLGDRRQAQHRQRSARRPGHPHRLGGRLGRRHRVEGGPVQEVGRRRHDEVRQLQVRRLQDLLQARSAAQADDAGAGHVDEARSRW